MSEPTELQTQTTCSKPILLAAKVAVFLLLALGVTFLCYFTIPEVRQLIFDKSDGTVPDVPLLCSLVTIFALTLFFIWVSTAKFVPRFAWLFFLLLPSAMAWYLGFKYKVVANEMFFADVLATTGQEASGFFGVQVALFGLVFVLLILLLAFAAGRLKLELIPFKSKPLRGGANIVFAVLVFSSFYFYVMPTMVYYYALRNLWRAEVDMIGFYNGFAKLEEIDDHSRIEGKLPEDTVLLLHIGESVRGDRSPLNGYERDTTPRLLEEQQKRRLFNFPKAISFANFTRQSVMGIMTSASIKDPVVRGRNITFTLRQRGVYNYAFFSSMNGHEGTDRFNVITDAFTAKAEKRFYSAGFAHTLLPQFKDFFAGDARSPMFILYYGEGSHAPFDKYDTDRFSVFMPVNFNSNQDSSTGNAYDNTVVCLDDFIGNVINMLQDKSAVYIYASDHGEVMGENGKWGRSNMNGMEVPCMRHVLFFIWTSDKFRSKEPYKSANLAVNAKKLSAVSHDHIYHTILGAFNIRNIYYDSSLDLFSADAKPFVGPFPEDLPPHTRLPRTLFSDSFSK